MDTQQPQLAPIPSEVFIAEVGRMRRRKELTQQQLADRFEAIGSPIDRSTIGKIEAGKRGVSVDELFSFALALGVSPMSLVVPRSGKRIRIAPDCDVATEDVVSWIQNVFPLWISNFERDHSEDRFFAEAITDAEDAAYGKYPNLRSLVQDVSVLLHFASSTEPTADDTFRICVSRLAQLVQRMWEDIGESGSALMPADNLDRLKADRIAAAREHGEDQGD